MPRTLRIGRRNSTFQVLESLRANRQKRHRSGRFLLEGVLPITQARRHGWQFDALLYAAGARLSSWASEVVADSAADRYELDPPLLDALSGRDDPSELLALVRMPGGSLDRIPPRADLLVVLVDRPASPGNLGSLIRSCDALGGHGVIVTGHGVDVYDPSTIAASRGSLFALPVVQADSHASAERWAATVRAAVGACHLVGADERATLDAADHDFTAPTVIVLGNETSGLSRAYRERCDVLVRIPMTGSATSLNLAAAGSILLYEAAQQRRRNQACTRE